MDVVHDCHEPCSSTTGVAGRRTSSSGARVRHPVMGTRASGAPWGPHRGTCTRSIGPAGTACHSSAGARRSQPCQHTHPGRRPVDRGRPRASPRASSPTGARSRTLHQRPRIRGGRDRGDRCNCPPFPRTLSFRSRRLAREHRRRRGPAGAPVPRRDPRRRWGHSPVGRSSVGGRPRERRARKPPRPGLRRTAGGAGLAPVVLVVQRRRSMPGRRQARPPQIGGARRAAAAVPSPRSRRARRGRARALRARARCHGSPDRWIGSAGARWACP